MRLNFLLCVGQPAMTKNDPVQNASSAESEKLCSSVRITSEGQLGLLCTGSLLSNLILGF